jgi:glycosyltransferase involved in cell wall biosynthesis
MPAVSAIVPIYNPRPDYLDEAIRSIASQSFKDLEIVVVNDGSTDRAFEAVLRKYAPLIRYVEQDNSGVARARNAGLAAAAGRYIGFLDQDDRWRPGKLEKQVAILKDDPDVDVVFHRVSYIDGDGKQKKVSRLYARRFKRQVGAESVLRGLMGGNFIYSPAVLVRRKCFEEVGGFDPAVDPHDDWDMWLRLAIAGFKFKAIDEALAEWRAHSANTSRDLDRMLRTRRAVIEKLADGELLSRPLRRQLDHMRAACLITQAHHFYKNQQYDRFREEVRGAFKMYWPSVLQPKIIRRWCRSVVLERVRQQ